MIKTYNTRTSYKDIGFKMHERNGPSFSFSFSMSSDLSSCHPGQGGLTELLLDDMPEEHSTFTGSEGFFCKNSDLFIVLVF